jgi:hypothetical protein
MRIGPERTRAGLDTCQLRTPAWTLSKVLGPQCGWSGLYTWGSWTILEVRTVYPGVRYFPMVVQTHCCTLEYITFSGHVAAPEPPMWWGQALLLAQSSRLRLGRVMVWSHVQLLYHATKDSRVGTGSSYSSKGYPSFRVPTYIYTTFCMHIKNKSHNFK